MTAPIPRLRPKRAKARRKVVVFRGVPDGERIYAPRGGVVGPAKGGVKIVTPGGRVHIIRGVKPRARTLGKRVGEAEFIGRAIKRRVVYSIRHDGKPVDAMKPCKRHRWYPGALRMRATEGGDMSTGGGDTCRAVPHWIGERVPDIRPVGEYVVVERKAYNILFDTFPGAPVRAVQHYPATVGARSMANATGFASNRYGKVCIQIGFNGGPYGWPGDGRTPTYGTRRLIAWCESWGVPRRHATTQEESGWITHREHRNNFTQDMPRMKWREFLQPWTRR